MLQTEESEFPDVLRPVQHLLQAVESREDAAALPPVQVASLLRALQPVELPAVELPGPLREIRPLL